MDSALNADTLLAAWEDAAGESPLARPLILLQAAWPETPRHIWAARPVGERDGHLLKLREKLFGERVETVARCPACGERVEVDFATSDVTCDPPSADGFELEACGAAIRFRLPTTEDLVEAARAGAAEARRTIIGRCIACAGSLPPEAIDQALDAMARADPQADVQIALACPACSRTWSLPFDIVSHLWEEIEDWAHRILREVHVLASAYGWSEREVLGLSARRRRIYLEAIEG